MTVRLFAEHTDAEVPVVDGAFSLEEQRTYRLRGVDPGANVSLGELPLRWNAVADAFDVPVGRWVGLQELRIDSIRRPIRIVPREEKLSTDEWISLLDDVERWLPGGIPGREGGTTGGIATSGASAPLVAASVGPLIPALDDALRSLLDSPAHRRLDVEQDVSIHAVGQVGGDVVRWLGAHPTVHAAIDRWAVARSGERSPSLPIRVASESEDHPVNRYVAWGIRRVLGVLSRTASALEASSHARDVDPDSAAWFRARANGLRLGADKLGRRFRWSFLSGLRPEPPSDSAILKLHDEPGYARIHRLMRRILSPRFQLSPNDAAAAVRPSYELFEIWVFLALVEAMAERLPDWRVDRRGIEEILMGRRGGAEVAFSSPAGRLVLHFNLTFAGFLSRGEAPERFTLSKERRPDVVARWVPESGMGRWLCVDAKYRAGASNLGDAFESAHVYRDSLRWPAAGGACACVILATPSLTAGCEPWYSPAFRAEYGCGAARIRPRTQDCTALAGVILETLGAA